MVGAICRTSCSGACCAPEAAPSLSGPRPFHLVSGSEARALRGRQATTSGRRRPKPTTSAAACSTSAWIKTGIEASSSPRGGAAGFTPTSLRSRTGPTASPTAARSPGRTPSCCAECPGLGAQHLVEILVAGVTAAQELLHARSGGQHVIVGRPSRRATVRAWD